MPFIIFKKKVDIELESSIYRTDKKRDCVEHCTKRHCNNESDSVILSNIDKIYIGKYNIGIFGALLLSRLLNIYSDTIFTHTADYISFRNEYFFIWRWVATFLKVPNKFSNNFQEILHFLPYCSM